jgi:hypothetical protein
MIKAHLEPVGAHRARQALRDVKSIERQDTRSRGSTQ